MAVKFNPDYQTSEGTYYKDPVTMRELTRDEVRVSGPNPEDTGPFNWPRIKVSNGDIVKIAFRLFNDEERACYKAYRSRGKSRPVKEPKKEVPVETSVAHSHVEPDYDNSVASMSTEEYINKCDTTLGIWMWDGMIHDLLAVSGSHEYRVIPRALISVEDRRRLNLG